MIFTLPKITGSNRLIAVSVYALLLAACTAETGSDRPAPAPSGEEADIPAVASEDTVTGPGSTFAAIEGQWAVRSVGNTPFPGNQGIVNFQSETFFSHEAGCGGGHPAFYEATPGGDLRTSRREAVIIGKCSGPQAASLERLLADFIDRASGWSLQEDGSLVLTAADGTRAVLGRPEGRGPNCRANGGSCRLTGRRGTVREPPASRFRTTISAAGRAATVAARPIARPGPVASCSIHCQPR